MSTCTCQTVSDEYSDHRHESGRGPDCPVYTAGKAARIAKGGVARMTKERASISAEGSELMMELFNRMPIESLKSVPEPIAKRIGDFMVANGYRIVFDRWYLQAEPRSAPEPSEGYSQHYADQMRTALLRIAQPVFINSKPAYADPDNVKAICDGLNERIKIAQDALLGLGKRTNV